MDYKVGRGRKGGTKGIFQSMERVTNEKHLYATENSRFLERNMTEQLIFLWILFACIVIGNSVVLGAIRLSGTGSRSRVNFFITHLAIADLMSGLVSVLMDIIWKMTVQWYAGNVMCKLARFMQAVVTFASTYVLVALSIDRLDAIAWPLHFTNSSYRAKVLIYLAWGFSMIFSLPMLFITNELKVNGLPQCWIQLPEAWHWKVYMTLVTVTLFIMPALLILLCYVMIIHVIWNKGKVMQPANESKSSKTGKENSQLKVAINIANHTSRSVITQAKIRTIKMTFIIVLMFVICWSPYMIFDLLQVYGHLKENQQTVAISTFVNSLAPLNSAANPIIYGIFSTRICQNLRNIPCINKLFYKGEYKRPSSFNTMNNTSWTSHSHVNSSASPANYGTTNDRRKSPGIPLVRKKLSEKDNTILMKHLTVKSTETPDVDMELQTPEEQV